MKSELTPVEWFIDNMPESLFLNKEVVEKLGMAKKMERENHEKIYNQAFEDFKKTYEQNGNTGGN